MYSYVDSVSLSRSIGSQWEHVDLSNVTVLEIFNSYSKVFLVLLDDNTNTEVFIDLDSLRLEFSNYPDTIISMLVEIGNRVLTTVPSLPNTDVKHVKYSDAIRSQYKIEITRAGVVLPDNYPKDELEDIRITRPKYETDLSLLHTHCLMSVNGMYHMSDTDGSQAYVYDAAKTLRHTNSNHIGITSFLDVGELTKIPLDVANIHGESGTNPLIDKTIFSVTENLDGKSYMLVLGGYLVLPEYGVFWRNGADSFAIDLNKIPYVERIYESSLYIDMSSLGLTEFSSNPDAIALNEIKSDEVIRKYFTLSQSYLVLVDTPNLISNKVHLRHSNLPGMFTAYQDPTMPLYASYGKLAEYWKTYEDNQWSVTVEDSFLRNYILSFQTNPDNALVSNNLLPMRPYDHSRGYMLDIMSFN